MSGLDDIFARGMRRLAELNSTAPNDHEAAADVIRTMVAPTCEAHINDTLRIREQVEVNNAEYYAQPRAYEGSVFDVRDVPDGVYGAVFALVHAAVPAATRDAVRRVVDAAVARDGGDVDYVCGAALKCSLANPARINLRLYDRDYGRGRAASVLLPLGARPAEPG